MHCCVVVAMLGEAFIRVFRYSKEDCDCDSTKAQERPPHPAPNIVLNQGSMLGNMDGLVQSGPRATTRPSDALTIPNSHSDDYGDLELYRSWCCTTFCKDYPDLQLRGDHVGNRSSMSLRLESEVFQGPLLQSQDLGELESLEPTGPVEPGVQVESQTLQDESNLVIDSSIITLNREPLSNSMLNGYLESKLLEVYRQHMQDSLARGSSPLVQTPPQGLVPEPVKQLSQYLCQDHGLDSSTAQSIVIHYLSTCTVASSNFSSPDLRISNLRIPNPEPRKKPT
ncbi:TLR adapter interacting with SLC15A4 on the lysosome-like isoform X1 [Oncorhynchus nerka]|uniref:TLR adapter interacting with SLC15A4 on the lysosome-like isoform X1 n=3 Tax=Oncorhynchus nerka TaxID=8023 RepID=UPI0011328CB7|nr:uncharacterized protein CXorf21 homolog isoform X1 [Oncorhynchus nerka]